MTVLRLFRDRPIALPLIICMLLATATRVGVEIWMDDRAFDSVLDSEARRKAGMVAEMLSGAVEKQRSRLDSNARPGAQDGMRAAHQADPSIPGDGMAQRLANATGARISIADEAGVWSSSASSDERDAIAQGLVDRTLREQQAVATHNLAVQRYSLYTPIRLGGRNVVAIVQMDTGPLLASRNHLLANSALLGVLTLLVALGGCIWFILRMLGPLKDLRVAAEDIAMRHGTLPPMPRRGNELKALQTAFGAMSDQVTLHGHALAAAQVTSEKENAELAERERNARYLAMVADRTHNAVIITDARGRIEWVNGGFTRITGYTLSESLGRKPGEFLQGAATDRAAVAAIRGNLAHGRGFKSELLNYAKDGREFWVEIEVQPIHDADGNIEKFIAIELDITGRKQHEQALKSAEAFLGSVIDHTPVMLFVKDARDLAYLRVNQAAERMTGLSCRDFIGHTDRDLLPPERAEASMASDREVLAGRHPVDIPAYRIRNALGASRVWRIRKVPLFDDTGEARYLLGMAEDVTENVEARNALEESERRFRMFAETMPDSMFITNPEKSHYFYVNPAVEHVWGVTPQRLYADPSCLTPMLHEDDRELFEVRERMERALEPVYLEFRIHHPSRGLRWLSVQTQAVRMPDGEIRVHGLCKDITLHRAQQEALLAAKEEAESANRSKSQFLANMSHEIRTPMNGVLGMTELLLGTGLTDRQRRFAETVYRSGEALLDIINDILDFSRIEAGRLELQIQEFSLVQLVEEVAELLAPRAHQRRIELIHDLAPAVPARVAGDPGRLRQVLINLIGNAIKFTEEGEVQVSVGIDANAAAAGHARVRVSVRDTGIGIPRETQQRLFKVFEQGSAATARRYGGTGLGLAISQQLVQMMGGLIEVDSAPGKGSIFAFALDFEVRAARPAPASAPRSEAYRHGLAQKRVLVVEDNPTNRGILLHQMENWDMACDAAESGQRALEKMEAAASAGTPFEAALIDMKMPGMSGIELAERIRANPRLASTRMLMLTSLSGAREEARARAAGIEIYLQKPVRQGELRCAIAEALRVAPGIATRATGGADALSGRALVVEDNPVNREIAAVMLEQLGCEFQFAENGRQALEVLANNRFDVVLMDCQMPEMDGFQALRHIRDGGGAFGPLAVSAQVPVVALTANALAGDRDACIAAGFDDYLSKPFSEADLRNVLSAWLPQADPQHPDDKRVLPLTRTDAYPLLANPGAQPATTVACGTSAPGPLESRTMAALGAMEAKGAAGLVARLANAFAGSAPAHMAALRRAAAAGDAGALRHAAHALKSSHANLGALDASKTFAAMEADARGGRMSAAVARLGAAEYDFERALEAIKSLESPKERHDELSTIA